VEAFIDQLEQCFSIGGSRIVANHRLNLCLELCVEHRF